MDKLDKEIFKYLATKPCDAVARVRGGEKYPQIDGIVEFYSLAGGVVVIADIENLPSNGFFAFHIHEGESCDDDFGKTGGHLGSEESPHPMHKGDLPPLLSCNGSAWMAVYTGRVTIDEILNRVIVIHEGVDDFTSQPAGNSGEKIACGKPYT